MFGIGVHVKVISLTAKISPIIMWRIVCLNLFSLFSIAFSSSISLLMELTICDGIDFLLISVISCTNCAYVFFTGSLARSGLCFGSIMLIQ